MLDSKLLDQVLPTIKTLSPIERLELIKTIVSIDEPQSQNIESTENAWNQAIQAEAEVWQAKSLAERAPYLGRYVAVFEGNVIDFDESLRALYLRVRMQYPNKPVLITKAETTVPREFSVLSPRFEHLSR